MRFIRQHTSIPVPKVYCAFAHRGETYIVMERIGGQMLGQNWVLGRSAEAKARLLGQLKAYVQEMRRLPPPGEAIANVDGGPLHDVRIDDGDPFGPFGDTQEFHRFLRNGFERAPGEQEEIATMIEMQRRDWGKPVFTHGDLSSLNVFIRGDDVVAILDWENAGWLPSYWEYTAACQVAPANAFWAEYIDEFLEAIPEALTMERIRQRNFHGLG